MRNFKRFLSMALTMLMLVGSLSVLTSAKFEDVTDFQNEIAVLGQLGVIKGKADGTFGFDENVTRRQAALFFARATTGKVDDALNWQSKVNNTPFTDLDPENDYYGAISYNHNMGIVKGKSATAFAPNDNITFQEAITMAVRALGYKGADMDAGYPYSYYSKAVSLGLDKGIENVALTDTVTRGVMAKIIYNMLFATNSKGTTIAAEAFGSAVKTTTLVLAATKGKKLVANLGTNASDTVAAFVELNSDGTFNYNKVYHFTWKTFAELAYGEGATEKAFDKVGASYSVVTIDNFKSLVTVSENASKVLTDYTGNGKIDDTQYSLVDKWSSVYNIGTTISGKDELIQFTTASYPGYTFDGAKKAYYAGHWYVVNDKGNILGTDGSELLYYYENVKDKVATTTAATFPFYYKLGTGDNAKYYPAYLPVDGTRYAGAATVDQIDKVPATYSVTKDDASITTNVSAYAETVVYDDNNDGVYDRAYFTAYNFGRFFKTTDGGDTYYNVRYGAHGPKVTGANDNKGYKNITLVDKTDGVKDGDYVLWAFDAVNEILTIKKVFNNAKIGYITYVDVVNDTITVVDNLFNYGLPVTTGKTLKYGVATLPGATDTHIDGVKSSINRDKGGYKTTEELIGVNPGLYGKAVSYIVDDEHDDKVIAIVDIANADTPLVVTSVDYSYYSFGNLRVTVIDNNGTMQVINVSAIDNIPVLNWFGVNPLQKLGDGQLVFGKLQKDGTWILSTAVPYKEELKTGAVTYTYVNGYGYKGNSFVHKADGSKLVIVNAVKTTTLDEEDKVESVSYSYQIASGVPANGSTITVTAPAKVYYQDAYMYILSEVTQKVVEGGTTVTGAKAAFSEKWNVITTGWQVGKASDVIYLASTGVHTTGNKYGTYLFTGNYFSILTGAKNTDVGSALYSNFMLEADNFYEVTMVKEGSVTNVIVLNKIDLGAPNFEEVYVKSIDNEKRIIVLSDEYGNEDILTGKEGKLIDWKASPKSVDTAPAAKKDTELYTAYRYVGEPLKDTTNKVYFLVDGKVDIQEKVTGKVITSVELDAKDNPKVGDEIKVTKITTLEDGVPKTYAVDEEGKAPEFFKDVTFVWYYGDQRANYQSGKGAAYATFDVRSVHEDSKIKVVVYIDGYTPNVPTSANTAETVGVVLP